MTATEDVAPGHRRALGAVAAQFWINGMVYAAIVPRLPDIRDRLSIDVARLGLILTLSAAFGLFGSAVAGPVIARFGTRRAILAATAITLAALPLVGLATSSVALVLVLGSLAILDVVIDIGMNIQGSRLSARRRTPVMNRLHGLWSLGTVMGGLISVLAIEADVPIWLHLLGVSVGLGLLSLVVSNHLLATDEPAGDRPDHPAPPMGGTTARPRFTTGHAVLLALLGGTAVTMELTTSDWAAFRLVDDLAVSPGQVGLGFVAFTSGMVTGRFAGDTVQSIVGPRTLVRSAATLAAAGLILATLVPAGGFISPIVLAVGGFYVAALGVSVIFPQLYDAAAKAPGPPGRGLAALTAGTRMAGLGAPVIVGLLADTTLSVGSALAIVTLPCCLVTILIPPDAGRRRGEPAAVE